MTDLTLTEDETREAVLLMANLARNPDAIPHVARELALLRSVVREARRNRYLRAAPTVRAVLDRLPRRI